MLLLQKILDMQEAVMASGREPHKIMLVLDDCMSDASLLKKKQVLAKLTDDELRAKTEEFRGRIENGESAGSLLVEAFAVAREAVDDRLDVVP